MYSIRILSKNLKPVGNFNTNKSTSFWIDFFLIEWRIIPVKAQTPILARARHQEIMRMPQYNQVIYY
jgi:hypothetical protein